MFVELRTPMPVEAEGEGRRKQLASSRPEAMQLRSW
jgi:hypothetical protein